jgi:hypothetical protein
MFRRAISVTVLVVITLFVGGTAATAAEIQVCEHKNYGGRCVTLLHGVNDLRDWGMSDRISSFRIRSGTWRMCGAPNLQGACQDFTRSVSDLAGTRLQDTVSSLRPVRVGTGGGATAIVVYTAPNFRGRSLVFSDDIADLRMVGLNDRISSVRVLSGRWVMCTDINYVGCRAVVEDMPDLGAIGWGSRISSIREGQNWWNAGGGRRGYAGGSEGGGRPGYGGGAGAGLERGGPGNQVAKLGPASGAEGLGRNVELTWGRMARADYYEICVDQTNNNSCDTVWRPGAQATVLTLENLRVGTYYWQVRALLNGALVYGDGGRWWSFRVAR